MSLEEPLLSDQASVSTLQFLYKGAPSPSQIFCVKAFPGLIIRNISNIDTKNCKVVITFTLVLRLKVHKLEEGLREIVKQQLVIRVNQSDYHRSRFTVKEVFYEGQLYFSVHLRESATCQMDYEFMHETPFDSPKLFLKLKLPEIVIRSPSEARDEPSRYIWFNFFTHETNMANNISIKRHADQLPEYRVRFRRFRADIVEKKAEGTIRHFPQVNYQMQLLRRPFNKLILTFLPMLLLSIFTIITFDIDDGPLVRRVALLATVFLAYVAFIPSMRNETPSFSYMTLPDFCIICQLLANIACVFYSCGEQKGYISPYFLQMIHRGTLILIFLPFLLIFLLTLKHLHQRHFKAGSIEMCMFNKKEFVFSSQDYSNKFLQPPPT